MAGICCIPGCENEISEHARARTCANCRQNMHNWERRRPAEIVDRARRLRVWRARMETFSVVKDDEVTKVDHDSLEQRKLMFFPKRVAKSVRKAKASVVAFKLRDRARKQA